MSGPVAFGQPGGPLPPAIIQKAEPPDAAQKTQIQEYVNANSANLGGAIDEKFRRDRDNLLAPLGDAKISTSFRLEYGRTLNDVISKLSKDADRMRAINGLFMAGELATKDSLLLLQDYLSAEHGDMRYAAAAGIRRAFLHARGGSSAILPEQVRVATEKLGGRLKVEADSLVLEAVVLGLNESAQSNEQRAFAIELLGSGAAARIREAKPEAMDAARLSPFVRAVLSVRETLASAQGAGRSLGAAAAKSAADLGGSTIAHAVRVVEKGGLAARAANTKLEPRDARELYAQLVADSETILQLSAQALGKASAVTAKNLGATLRTGTTLTDAQFGEDARSFVGPKGSLVTSPFDFPAKQFLDK
jgi:hypothetical protein